MARAACALAALICSVPIGASAVSAAVAADDNGTRGASASETIPTGARILRISVHGSLKREQATQRPLRVTSAKKIDEVVALLNALPADQPGARSCPADFGIRVRLAFYASRDTPPLAVAEVDPEGCGAVQLTIDGRQQPTLEGGSLLIQHIDHALGVKLNTRPRAAPRDLGHKRAPA